MSRKESKKMRNIALTLVIVAIAGFTSCEQYIWDPPEYIPPDTTGGFDTIFFNTDIAPLFVNNNCTGCHKSGGTSPDLTAASAYDALVPDYVNLDNPPNSEIYTKIDDGHMGGMPFDDKKLILDWIYQGARNFTE
jgi:hypothetical protein